MGILLKNIQFDDTGLIDTTSLAINDIDDIDRFLEDASTTKESTAGIDLGALYALNVLRRPITIGVSINNIVGDDFRNESSPMILNAGIAFVPFRGLFLEVNFVDLLEEEAPSDFSETGIRIGVEYSFSSLQIRSGLIGDNVSFGVGLGSEQFLLDYGVVEVDHNSLRMGRVKETYQSIQVSLNTRFF